MYDLVRLTEDQADSLDVRFRLLNELLRTSDIISVHVPLTPMTGRVPGRGVGAVGKWPAVATANGSGAGGLLIHSGGHRGAPG